MVAQRTKRLLRPVAGRGQAVGPQAHPGQEGDERHVLARIGPERVAGPTEDKCLKPRDGGHGAADHPLKPQAWQAQPLRRRYGRAPAPASIPGSRDGTIPRVLTLPWKPRNFRTIRRGGACLS